MSIAGMPYELASGFEYDLDDWASEPGRFELGLVDTLVWTNWICSWTLQAEQEETYGLASEVAAAARELPATVYMDDQMFGFLDGLEDRPEHALATFNQANCEPFANVE